MICYGCHFNQEGFKMLTNVEQLLLKACAGQNFADVNFSLQVFRRWLPRKWPCCSACHSAPHLQVIGLQYITDSPSIETVKSALLSLSLVLRSLVSEVCKLLQLLLIMLATNSSSERSFSALRRVKTYHRNTTGQARLNHLLILHYHIEKTD